ncbi:MAG: glycosyltransferase [Pseudomonadota bacterium]
MSRTIVFLINSLAGGGAERVMATLLAHSGTMKGACDVHLVLLDDEPRAYDVPSWVQVTQLDARGSLPKSYLQTRRLFKQLKPDVCLSFLTRANVVNAALKGLGHQVLISERVNTSAHLQSRFARAIVKQTYPKAHRVLCVSSGVASDLAAHFAVPKARMQTIANPLDGAAIAARAQGQKDCALPDGPYFVAMGRFVETKNFSLLLSAFAKADIAANLVLLGDGPLRPALEQQRTDLQLHGRVLMPGFQENPFPTIAGARAFVLPSNAEGFPNALVEAMGLSVPVIATNCASGPSEILAETDRDAITFPVDAPYGMLIPCNDANAMARAMEQMEDAGVRQRLSAQAGKRAADFTPEKAAKAYWGAIQASLERADA